MIKSILYWVALQLLRVIQFPVSVLVFPFVYPFRKQAEAYSYLTKNNAYICIFTDIGQGGIPLTPNQNTLCCVYDELSAVSCYETIKQGYDANIIVCYAKKSELLNIVKMINKIIPRLVKQKISLDFFQLKNPIGNKSYLQFLSTVIEILINQSKAKNLNIISLPITPLIFSQELIESVITKMAKNEKYPIFPLFGVDMKIFDSAKEIGLENKLSKLKKTAGMSLDQLPLVDKKEINSALKSNKSIEVTVGPNNVHDIFDALE